MLLLIILLLLLFGVPSLGYHYYGAAGGIGPFGLILIILLVLYLTGALGPRNQA